MNLNIKHIFYILVFLNTSTFFGQASNQPPTVTAVGNQIYCPQSQQRIVTSFDITDPDPSDTTIDAFYIQISSGYVNGEDQLLLTGSHPGISASWNPNEAKLTLTKLGGGPVLITEIISAVKDVVFTSSNINISAKTFSLTAGSANYLASTGHYYDFISSNLITWTAAKDEAETKDYFGLQGYLATLTSPDEAQIAGELTPGTGWIGASDAGSEGVWKWVTGPEAGTTFWNGAANGSTPNYANWNSGEPNNYGSGEDYAHITFNTGVPGSWNDLPNNTSTGQPSSYQAKGYVIEYGRPGDPPLSITGSTTLSPPQILSTSPSISCSNDPAMLSATSNTTDILWYDSQNGGNLLFTGSNYSPMLTTSTTFWVLASNNGCTSGERVAVTATVNSVPMVDTPADVSVCDNYTLPALTNGSYFTARNGGGTELNAGEVISTSTTLFVYAETGTTPNCTDEHFFDITINTTPLVDSPADVSACDSYALPALSNGNYYTATNGGGTPYFAGDDISTTTTLYVYAESAINPNCYDQHPFTVTINATPAIDRPVDTPPICDSYILPALTIGNYYTAPNGGGTQLNAGEIISTSTTLFVYAETGTTPNCSDEHKFNVIINTTPTIDTPGDVFNCESYTLPTLTNGNYYTAPNGGGTLLNAGDILSASTTLYIYAESALNPTCNDQHRFTITIHPTLISILSLEAEVTSEDFDDNQTIVASATGGNGDYEYQLDRGPWQSSGVFENVFGCEIHTVRAREVLGCSTMPEKNINLMYFPKFFTPNNDGFNDTWNIECLSNDSTAMIRIFDRFGKLLIQFKPSLNAWNGTFNGSMLAATDYWFVVSYQNSDAIETQFKSHFSLKH